MIYLAKRMNGSEAASIGLVNECVEAGAAEARALEMAGDIAKQGPIAIRMAKAAIDGGSDVRWDSMYLYICAFHYNKL